MHWLAGTPSSLRRWDVTEVGRGTRASVSGVANAPPPTGLADDVVGFSRVSCFHWAPSIAAAGGGAVWFAYGNGVLHLARFGATHGVLEDGIVDIDRSTGFAPRIATRGGALGNSPGAAAIAHKDVHGSSTIDNGIDFLNVPIDPASLFPPQAGLDIHDVRLTGGRMSFAPGPSPPQQGGIRFQVDLPGIRVEGERSGIGFAGESTEPSVFTFEVAPFIAGGQVVWHTRSVSGRIGHIDVDVHLDVLTWVGVIGGILTANPALFLLVIVDPVAGTIATDQTNEQLAAHEGVPLGGLPGQLTNLLARHALRKAFGTETDIARLGFEAVHLDRRLITFFLRTTCDPGDAPPATDFAFFPQRAMNFGSVTVGEEAARIEGPDAALFTLNGPTPTLVQGRQSGTVTVAFTPAAMITVGHRATLVVESNADNDPVLRVNLFGAGAASSQLVMPTEIAFNPSALAAVPPPGLGSTRSLTVYNVGVATLTVAGSSLRIVDGAGQVSPHFELRDSAGRPVA